MSDVEVSADGSVLMLSTEARYRGRTLPLRSELTPRSRRCWTASTSAEGLHTATFGEIAGRRYAFTARNPGQPALTDLRRHRPVRHQLAASVPIPPTYGIHDTYVRDGLAFVFAWNAGVIIYDVGNGIRGRVARRAGRGRAAWSPTNGVGVARGAQRVVVPQSGDATRSGTCSSARKGPAGSAPSASGDIHVVDVSDLRHPARWRSTTCAGRRGPQLLDGRGGQVLYAAYYNGGVVALDVSGTLQRRLSNRLIGARSRAAADDTFTWGVMLANGSLYASDMLSGLWQVAVEP